MQKVWWDEWGGCMNDYWSYDGLQETKNTHKYTRTRKKSNTWGSYIIRLVKVIMGHSECACMCVCVVCVSVCVTWKQKPFHTTPVMSSVPRVGIRLETFFVTNNRFSNKTLISIQHTHIVVCFSVVRIHLNTHHTYMEPKLLNLILINSQWCTAIHLYLYLTHNTYRDCLATKHHRLVHMSQYRMNHSQIV